MKKIEKIELKNITKRFPGVLANNDVNMIFNSGEIHTLLGENGAGKSTLMRILYGMYRPDAGEILINEKMVNIRSPLDAINLGIGMVHQHFMLVPSFTVIENIVLNYPSKKKPFLDLEDAKKRINTMFQKYEFSIDPSSYVWQLSVGEQQRVEILKILFREAEFLILDEPTAVLTPQETNELFKILKKLKESGIGIIFISHKLKEVLSISDKISVLRDGKVIGEVKREETDENLLAKMMVDREIESIFEKKSKPREEVILRIENLKVLSDKNIPAVKNFSLMVKKGEIVGVAGVSGNGQNELAEAIVGLREIRKGKIFLNKADITNKNPYFIIKEGISSIPEERMEVGVIKDFTVLENMILKNHGVYEFARWIVLKFNQIKNFVTSSIKEFDVRTPSINTLVRNLSGGNIQKLILAREFSSEPKVLIASQPTRGLDIRATEYIHKKLIEKREEGCSTLLISEDLDEIICLSDRIVVMYEGEIIGEVPPSIPVEKIGLLMMGVKE